MIKTLIYILILTVFWGNSAFAQIKSANINYSGFPYEFKQGDEVKFLNAANSNMILSEKSSILSKRIFYLQEAMRYYFMLAKANPKSIDAQIGLDRVYDEMRLDRFAKEHFFNAINFNSKNPNANFHFGNFYYKRKDLITALYYYKISYSNGYAGNYHLNYLMGSTYEKLADIKAAKNFYFNAVKLNPNDTELRDKIRLIDELDYSQLQHYSFKTKKS